ncbi:MAG: hypothetical protein ACI814_003485 [Mariniblastus sp.]|jgi:hypothetical protein
MKQKFGRRLSILIGGIALSIFAEMFGSSALETTSSDNKPQEQIELEIEEAVVSRNRHLVRRGHSDFVAPKHRHSIRQKTKPPIPSCYYTGHRLGNGLIAPLII